MVCQSIKPIVNFDLIHLTTLYLGILYKSFSKTTTLSATTDAIT